MSRAAAGDLSRATHVAQAQARDRAPRLGPARAGTTHQRARAASGAQRAMHHARGRGRTTHAAGDRRRRLHAIRHRVAVLGAQHEPDAHELAHRAHLVRHHAAGERDAANDLLGDVAAAAGLGVRDPEPAGRMEAVRDVGKPPLQVGHAVDEQHHHIDRRQPQIVRDAHVLGTQPTHERAGGVEQTDLVSRLDPQLLR
jgi:hypothetical protein